MKGLTRNDDFLDSSDRQIAVLDLEASASGTGSYPSEVGVALVRSPARAIATGSPLSRRFEMACGQVHGKVERDAVRKLGIVLHHMWVDETDFRWTSETAAMA